MASIVIAERQYFSSLVFFLSCSCFDMLYFLIFQLDKLRKKVMSRYQFDSEAPVSIWSFSCMYCIHIRMTPAATCTYMLTSFKSTATYYKTCLLCFWLASDCCCILVENLAPSQCSMIVATDILANSMRSMNSGAWRACPSLGCRGKWRASPVQSVNATFQHTAYIIMLHCTAAAVVKHPNTAECGSAVVKALSSVAIKHGQHVNTHKYWNWQAVNSLRPGGQSWWKKRPERLLAAHHCPHDQFCLDA